MQLPPTPCAGFPAQRLKPYPLTLNPPLRPVTPCLCARSSVRDAALDALEECHRRLGDWLADALASSGIRPVHLQELQARFAQPMPGARLALTLLQQDAATSDGETEVHPHA